MSMTQQVPSGAMSQPPFVEVPSAAVLFSVEEGRVRRAVPPGQEVTVGRSRACDLRVAFEPEDDHVSRHSATLRVLADCVLIRNVSSSKLISLRPLTGAARTVEPGAATTSLPWRQFDVVITGRFGRDYVVHVDARGLPPSSTALEEESDSSPTVVVPPIMLTPAQRRLLTALCEPLLTRSGTQASAATYRQVAERVGRRPGYVRNVFKQVREKLDSHGVPGLVSRERPDAAEDFRLPLAMWAIRSGTITHADLAQAQTWFAAAAANPQPDHPDDDEEL
ncbi:hypothetical protein KIH74_12165 [Kineosporia sp. J2-2]|uniref:FHA domain-containing protein n=1 Tax=Kineosporia corallincola TaxID=2835133 RepID=A0ABS5TF17_9ACTN|nr:hypothetical protein [Kineosporia corallincola]MBT0769683.1 hypothetical protein [Kineosporia corallincola]